MSSFEDKNPISGVQSKEEEICSSIIHGVGLFIAVACTAILIGWACVKNEPIMIVGYAIYGFGSISLYLYSTLFHSITNGKAKDILSIFDQSSIYLFIAGTYTPILLCMRSPLGWTIFGIIWFLTAIGIFFQFYMKGRSSMITNGIYMLMGWLFLGFMYWMLQNEYLNNSLFLWLLIGGGSYSLGVVFYLWKKLPYHHPIWHIFVIGGTVCHFFGLLQLVI